MNTLKNEALVLRFVFLFFIETFLLRKLTDIRSIFYERHAIAFFH